MSFDLLSTNGKGGTGTVGNWERGGISPFNGPLDESSTDTGPVGADGWLNMLPYSCRKGLMDCYAKVRFVVVPQVLKITVNALWSCASLAVSETKTLAVQCMKSYVGNGVPGTVLKTVQTIINDGDNNDHRKCKKCSGS